MQLVVDTNILVSFFRDNPVRFVILNSRLSGVVLFIPEYAIDELRRVESDILKYSRLDSRQFEESLVTLRSLITIVPKDSFVVSESDAKELAPHEKDIPFFALALKLGCAIWSNEPGFKEQSRVRVFNTKELLELVGLKAGLT